MHGTPNVVDSFTVLTPGEEPRHVDAKVHGHRMVEEFVAFARMVRERDVAERDARLAHSEIVLDVAITALRSAGIRLGSQTDSAAH